MQQFYLGVDVSKGYADFVMLDSKKKIMQKNFQLDDTFYGHSCLYDKLCAFHNENPNSTIKAAVESTGGYENNWYNSLIKFQGSLNNLQAARLNPLGVNANSKADLKRNNTDKISARSVAEYMIAHPEKVNFRQEDYFASLRKYWIFIQMLTKQSTQLLNQLESLIYTANPELLTFCKSGMPNWVLKLLRKYPTALNLSKANSANVSKIPYITQNKAMELIKMAKKSIGVSADEITEQIIKATVEQIISIKQTINIQTEIMMKNCTIHEVDLLKTFTGIGDLSAVGLMLEIQSIERFSTAKKLAAFFGLHPVYRTSGDGSSGFRMSKQGRKEPRKILFMVAMNAINSNELIKNIYNHHIDKGKSKMAALGICMHKILRIAYGMLKNNYAFDHKIDLKNREKTLNKVQNVTKDENRRYQDYDLNAPISRRQKLKRDERKKSHNDNLIKSGSKSPSIT